MIRPNPNPRPLRNEVGNSPSGLHAGGFFCRFSRALASIARCRSNTSPRLDNADSRCGVVAWSALIRRLPGVSY